MPRTLDAHYHSQYPRTSFTTAFLGADNLRTIMREVLAEVEVRLGDREVPEQFRTSVGFFSAAVLGRIMREAHESQTASPDLVPAANRMVRSSLVRIVTAECLAATTRNRFVVDGYPDPTNVPLALREERDDYTVETSDYMLSHPYGRPDPTRNP